MVYSQPGRRSIARDEPASRDERGGERLGGQVVRAVEADAAGEEGPHPGVVAGVEDPERLRIVRRQQLVVACIGPHAGSSSRSGAS
jgi:hypothetical protein